jgi:TonB-dependent SusC/RagA subfamily outer membrane receptor
MKKLLLSSLLIVLFTTSLSAQLDKNDALVLLDGKISNTDPNSIDPNKIESVNVLKGQAATDAYGRAGKNGVIIIKTKDNVKPDPSKDKISEALILVNGEEYTSGINSIDPNKIESVNVLKGQAASDAYGRAGKNGVIIIKTKDSVKLKK